MILGLDPGAADVGLLVLGGGEPLAYAAVALGELLGTVNLVRPELLRRVTSTCTRLLSSNGVPPDDPNVRFAVVDDTPWEVTAVAIENINSPGGWDSDGEKNPIQPASLITAAAVAGAVVSWADALGIPVVLVSPGRHGRKPLRMYPSVLVGPQVTVGTSDVLRHVRSAYDVAVAADGS